MNPRPRRFHPSLDKKIAVPESTASLGGNVMWGRPMAAPHGTEIVRVSWESSHAAACSTEHFDPVSGGVTETLVSEQDLDTDKEFAIFRSRRGCLTPPDRAATSVLFDKSLRIFNLTPNIWSGERPTTRLDGASLPGSVQPA